MLPTLYIVFSLAIDFIILVAVIYYFLELREREKRIAKKEQATDTNYHHVVDEALSKERKILDDATTEADQIITGAQYVTHESKKEVEKAIQDVVADIQKEGAAIAQQFTSEYTNSLKSLTSQSFTQFQTIMQEMQTDLKKQIETFHQSLLPEVEKELDTYKKTRMAEVDQAVTGIVQKASQEIFNKTISLSDHQQAVLDSLEKAKKEGVFT